MALFRSPPALATHNENGNRNHYGCEPWRNILCARGAPEGILTILSLVTDRTLCPLSWESGHRPPLWCFWGTVQSVRTQEMDCTGSRTCERGQLGKFRCWLAQESLRQHRWISWIPEPLHSQSRPGHGPSHQGCSLFG